MTKREKLQSIADELRTDDQYEIYIEYRGGAGWWVVASEPRWFFDEGEYLGRNYREAERSIRSILG